MKLITVLAILALSTSFKPSPKSANLNKQILKSYCAATVYSVTNNNSGGTVKFVKITGCGSDVNNTMNLTSGTYAPLNNGTTCTYKNIFIQVTGQFNSISLVYNQTVLQTQSYDPTNTTGRYSFYIENCTSCDIEVN